MDLSIDFPRLVALVLLVLLNPVQCGCLDFLNTNLKAELIYSSIDFFNVLLQNFERITLLGVDFLKELLFLLH